MKTEFRKIANLGLAAGFGAGVGFMAEKAGYDISTVEAMRDVALASIPANYLFSTDKDIREYDRSLENLGDFPYITPMFMAGITSGVYLLGGEGMEFLSGREINPLITSITGGIEGFITGIYYSAKARFNK